MSSNKKIAITSAVLILLIIITAASIIAIFAAAQQTVNSEVSVTYRSEYISGTASAKYYVGPNDQEGTQMRVNGDAEGATSIEFNSRNNNQAQTLSPVENEIKLTDSNNFVVFEYYFTNSNSQNDYMAKLTTSDSNVKNMTVTTSIANERLENFSNISTNVNDVSQLYLDTLVPANNFAYVYIKAEIKNLDNNADFDLNFNWDLGKTEPTIEKLSFNLADSNHYIVTGNDDASGVLVIPTEYGGYPVTEIAEDAFFNNEKITHLILPENLTKIGNTAFWGCSNLSGKIIFPETLTSIGEGAFEDCASITGSIFIPQNVTSIGQGAFGGLRKINEIKVDENNLYYTSRDASNNECNILFEKSTENLMYMHNNGTFPTGLIVNEIGEYAYYGYENELTTFEIPFGVTKIGQYAFLGSCFTNIVIPDSVTELEYAAFQGCLNLKEVKIGNGVKIIQTYTFYDCISLQNVILGSSVEFIDSYNFEHRIPLTTIEIPASLVNVNVEGNEFISVERLTLTKNIANDVVSTSNSKGDDFYILNDLLDLGMRYSLKEIVFNVNTDVNMSSSWFNDSVRNIDGLKVYLPPEIDNSFLLKSSPLHPVSYTKSSTTEQINGRDYDVYIKD